ncbi:MAG: cytochrome c peroxidase [Bacteroidota bacterium]
MRYQDELTSHLSSNHRVTPGAARASEKGALSSQHTSVKGVSGNKESANAPTALGIFPKAVRGFLVEVSFIYTTPIYVGLVLLVWGLTSCSSTIGPTPYAIPTPQDFIEMVIPPDNPTTVEGVELGRTLFFDPILSVDNTISCASCHRPELAFTDGAAVSSGLAGRKGRRSAPSLLNVGFHYKSVFWDGRSASLEEQALHPLSDSLEMGNNWNQIEQQLQSNSGYKTLFEAAFPGEAISKANTANALAQFQRTLISADSKYDRVQRGEASFTTQEQRGWTIFFDAGYPTVPMAECNHCHMDPLFTNLGFANTGLDSSATLLDFPDPGLGAITGNKYDNGKFRVPTLRNILVTAPYMHDGRMSHINDVIEHYNCGGAYAENVDPNVRSLHLSDQDKADLLAFLSTLTDSTALYNPNYYPFTTDD